MRAKKSLSNILVKSRSLNRRTFLKGLGVTLGLPLLDCMANTSVYGSTLSTAQRPTRFCGVYFPFGVSLPPKNHEDAEWGWFPQGEGEDFKFTQPLSSLESLRNQVTVLGGLSHPQCRKLGGHDTGDTFLTGSNLNGAQYKNSISLDQLIAQQVGEKTRFSSLILSSDGGVGEPTRSTTLSFSKEGRPIPALANPKQIFSRLFGKDLVQEEKVKRRELKATQNLLDRILEDSKDLKRRLGKEDQRRLEEYLDSVRSVEKRVERLQNWLSIPKPEVDPKSLNLEASPKAPQEYIRTMYDLIFLAFQSDSTRVATYMLGQVAGATTIANAFPAVIGLKGNWHGLAHGAGKKGGFKNLGRFDQFLTEQFHYFLTRLSETKEGEGSLLDHTVVLYGSSNSRTHNNRNYPLVLAGGNKLGFKHGKYHKFSEKVPLANLFVTVADRVGVPLKTFSDSSGELAEVCQKLNSKPRSQAQEF